MNLDDIKIWQVAAGDTNRDYAGVLLKWDVIAMGPGRYGEWPDCKLAMIKDDDENWTGHKIICMRRFCEEISIGDLVVLRVGTGDVRGVGTVVGGYEWNDTFGDVDGWDLQHIRRVRWLWGDTNRRDTKTFPANTMKFGDTVQLLDSRNSLNHTVRAWLEELNPSTDVMAHPLKELPQGTVEEATLIDVADYLFDMGMASGSVKTLLAEMDDLVRIARWYTRMRDKPPEHETVAYLVIPLLRALGWTPQKMGVEWNRVDVALFDFLPRLPQHLSGVVEAKKWGNSCLTAFDQAAAYIKKYGGELCERLIVTDGMRYGIFLRHQHNSSKGDPDFSEGAPDAYLNLTRLRWEYPILDCDGAGTGLQMMAADFRRLDGPSGARRIIRETKILQTRQQIMDTTTEA